MNATTLEMNRWDAKAKVREYAQAVKNNPRDAACRAGLAAFRALARGKRIVDVAQAIAQGGADAKGFPKLALARANWAECWFKACSAGDATSTRYDVFFSRDRFPSIANWRVDGASGSKLHLVPPAGAARLNLREKARARVPIIPPGLRPKSLAHYSILFEAEWDHVEPVDPFLLQYLAGSLYVVLAAWDLTPIEAAIFGATRSPSP